MVLDSERFLQALVDFACQPPQTFHHRWSVGDAVLFDNRRLLHRASPWDLTEERTLFLVTIEATRKGSSPQPPKLMGNSLKAALAVLRECPLLRGGAVRPCNTTR